MKNGVMGCIVGIAISVGIFVMLSISGIVDVELKQLNKVSTKPVEGYVPNKETAIKIAEAVWLPIYGKDVYEEQPFVAELNNGIWTVTGTLPQVGGKVTIGGRVEIDISKNDGKIHRVIHGK